METDNTIEILNIFRKATTIDQEGKKQKRKLYNHEVERLKELVPKDKFLVKYCVWNQLRHNGLYIMFVIDQNPERLRQCAADKSVVTVCTQEISDEEYNYMINNLDCHNRVMVTWSYDTVESLIKENEKMNVETPKQFIDYCQRKKLFLEQEILKRITNKNKMKYTKKDLYRMYNATSTETEKGSDELESYENWLERQLIRRLEVIDEQNDAGKEATSLIAHLKDTHGFNDVEEAAQEKIMKTFPYEGRW